MNEVELNEFRIRRLADAVNHVSKGNKTDFGRRLGYKDGAFVRQMLSGIRPVTEKTTRAVEAMAGMSGWFDEAARSNETRAAPEPYAGSTWPFSTISEAEIRALSREKLSALEGALALAIAQLKLGIRVSPGRNAPSRHSPGNLVDLELVEDEFAPPIATIPPPWEGGPTTKQMEDAAQQPAAQVSGAVSNIGPGEIHPANDEMIDVPELGDVRLAANVEGHENESEHQTGAMPFRRSFLRSVGADGGRGRVVYAKGDSMEPFINDGAALLVVLQEDLSVRNLATGGIYAIRHDGRMMVKRVAKDKLTGKWVARSLNEKYRDVPLENGVSVQILGRVVWTGTKLV
ncbi:S24 family peptidase [Achromobacter xylosoxidans]